MNLDFNIKNTVMYGKTLCEKIINDKNKFDQYLKKEFLIGTKIFIKKKDYEGKEEDIDYEGKEGINYEVEKEGINYEGEVREEKIEKRLKRDKYININDTHSMISSYPINSNFILTSKCKFIKLEIGTGDFLYIPRGWFHWVETEPKTIAINNEIKHIKSLEDNLLERIIKRGLPHKGKNNLKSIDYEKIKDKIINISNNGCIYSAGHDHSNVNKPLNKKERLISKDGIKELIRNEESKEGSFYSIYDSIKMGKLKKYCKIPEIDGINKNEIIYSSNILISFNKPTTMGIHYDRFNGILSVLSGRKTVYLSHWKNYKKLYITATKSL